MKSISVKRVHHSNICTSPENIRISSDGKLPVMCWFVTTQYTTSEAYLSLTFTHKVDVSGQHGVHRGLDGWVVELCEEGVGLQPLKQGINKHAQCSAWKCRAFHEPDMWQTCVLDQEACVVNQSDKMPHALNTSHSPPGSPLGSHPFPFVLARKRGLQIVCR